MKATNVLPIIAAILHGLAYVLYNVQIFQGKSKPNAVSWSIWALLAIINAVSYGAMVDNWIAALQFFTGSVASIATFLVGVFKKSFDWPSKMEWCIFALCIIAVFVGVFFNSAASSNMIVLLAFTLSTIPTIIGVFNDPRKEKSFPWYIWTIAFAITLINIILLGKEWIAYLTPVIGLIGHGLIGVLANKKRKQAFNQGMNYKLLWR